MFGKEWCSNILQTRFSPLAFTQSQGLKTWTEGYLWLFPPLPSHTTGSIEPTIHISWICLLFSFGNLPRFLHFSLWSPLTQSIFGIFIQRAWLKLFDCLSTISMVFRFICGLDSQAEAVLCPGDIWRNKCYSEVAQKGKACCLCLLGRTHGGLLTPCSAQGSSSHQELFDKKS